MDKIENGEKRKMGKREEGESFREMGFY